MIRARDLLALALLASPLAACSSATRFRDQPIVWKVDDTANIPEPKSREFLVAQVAADIFALRRFERALELRSPSPALDTNALDDLPDSSWFNNRIGRRTVTPEEAARGPGGDGPPRLPLTVTGGKVGGTNPGFIVRDATGRRFVVKFDPKEDFELQTANSVIVNRFFWTIGYNVPRDTLFQFTRSDLVLAADAKVGADHAPFTQRLLDDLLSLAPTLPNGSFRASASEFLDGIPKGGFSAEGTRDDDPNDRIPHEHRRVLRGLRVFAAWLDHTDMKEDNGLDVWVNDGGRRYLRHYLIDFGEALGGHSAEKGRKEDGYEYAWDWENQSKAALALGLWKRPWEDRKASSWRSVGSIAGRDFDPRQWREAYPYWPFFESDSADAFWAAKIVMRFDRPLVEALVATGELSSPAAARALVDTLLARRDNIGRAYLETVTPLDALHVEEAGARKLCGIDLGTSYGIAHGGIVERIDGTGRVLDAITIANDGRACVDLNRQEDRPSAGYVVVRLRVRRGAGDDRPAMQVHVAGGTRVVGILRVE